MLQWPNCLVIWSEQSILSIWSEQSILSIRSEQSILSIRSEQSLLSIWSEQSIRSEQSIWSEQSIRSEQSILSIRKSATSHNVEPVSFSSKFHNCFSKMKLNIVILSHTSFSSSQFKQFPLQNPIHIPYPFILWYSPGTHYRPPVSSSSRKGTNYFTAFC